jgi:hypothetical protein
VVVPPETFAGNIRVVRDVIEELHCSVQKPIVQSHEHDRTGTDRAKHCEGGDGIAPKLV